VGAISLSCSSHKPFHKTGVASKFLLKELEHLFIVRLSGQMIVVAPDPSLDEIYSIDGINWGGLIIACTLFDAIPDVASDIEPDESRDIRVLVHGLE
jgi:hypothetical protein